MNAADPWLMLTPAGALRAYGQREPDEVARTLRALLGGTQALTASQWLAVASPAQALYAQAMEQAWVQTLGRSMQGPDTRLDDFVQHVIASLSAQRQAVLASDSGFCLGRAGVPQDEADALSAAAADLSDFARRQARRGWAGAALPVSFCADPAMLLPQVSFINFWVDDAGYTLVLMGEPLLNNPALVELLWGIQEAGARFRVARQD